MSAANNFVPGSSGMAAGSDVPVAHLDHNYIQDCTDVPELEKIITVLRLVVNIGFLIESC